MEKFVSQKKLFLVLGILLLSGCVSARIPQYLADKHPYKKEFYANFDEALEATKKALEEFRWQVSEQVDPSVYERFSEAATPTQQLLLFTEIRHTPLFIGTRYAKMNVILRTFNPQRTEIELRYLTVTSLPFRSMESFRNDAAAKRLLDRIAQLLNSKEPQ